MAGFRIRLLSVIVAAVKGVIIIIIIVVAAEDDSEKLLKPEHVPPTCLCTTGPGGNSR